MYKSDQDRKKRSQKRAVQQAIKRNEDLPNGAHTARRENVRGEAGHRRILRRNINRSDRQRAREQLHDARRGDIGVEIKGKGLHPNPATATAHLTS